MFIQHIVTTNKTNNYFIHQLSVQEIFTLVRGLNILGLKTRKVEGNNDGILRKISTETPVKYGTRQSRGSSGTIERAAGTRDLKRYNTRLTIDDGCSFIHNGRRSAFHYALDAR